MKRRSMLGVKTLTVTLFALLLVGCNAAAAQPGQDSLVTNDEPTTDSSHWLDFSQHSTTSFTSVTGLLNAVTDDLSAADVEGAKRSLDRWDDFLSDELAWLGNNPPDDCYADLHAGVTGVFEDFREANELIGPFLDDFPNGDAADVDRATTLVSGAAAEIQDLTETIPPTNEVCTA